MIDRNLIRAKDVGLAVGILTLSGMLWTAYAKLAMCEENHQDLVEMKPRLRVVEERLIEQSAANTKQFEFIIKELDSIDRKVDR